MAVHNPAQRPQFLRLLPVHTQQLELVVFQGKPTLRAVGKLGRQP